MNTHLITVEQYEQFEGYPGLRDELINGRIVTRAYPKPLHRQIATNIQEMLLRATKGLNYVVNGNTNLKFSALHSMLAPDVLVVEDAAWLQAIKANEYLSFAPLMVVEVQSEANPAVVVRDKVEIYLRAGVRVVWIVDAKQRQVEVASNTVGHSIFNVFVPLPSPLAGVVRLSEILKS